MIIVGVYCFFTPVETSAVIPFVLGIVMIGDGIGRIVTWFDIQGVVRQSAWVLASAVVSLIFGDRLVDPGLGHHSDRSRFPLAQDQKGS